MKIVLCRTGFDAGNSSIPSPILPDGTLLSMPIPSSSRKIKYSNIYFENKSYNEILKELCPNFKHKCCHYDPVIVSNIYGVDNINRAVYGQCGVAQKHLENQKIKIGDLILFFGWFKFTKYDLNGKLTFDDTSPDINVIHSYMQISEIITNANTIIEDYSWHPHSDINKYKNNNCIYLARNNLSFNNNLPSYGKFKYSKNVVLTKEGMSRSKWDVPKCFYDSSITYHKENNFKENYFQSTKRGQVFVVSETNEITKWVKKFIESSI